MDAATIDIPFVSNQQKRPKHELAKPTRAPTAGRRAIAAMPTSSWMNSAHRSETSSWREHAARWRLGDTTCILVTASLNERRSSGAWAARGTTAPDRNGPNTGTSNKQTRRTYILCGTMRLLLCGRFEPTSCHKGPPQRLRRNRGDEASLVGLSDPCDTLNIEARTILLLQGDLTRECHERTMSPPPRKAYPRTTSLDTSTGSCHRNAAWHAMACARASQGT